MRLKFSVLFVLAFIFTCMGFVYGQEAVVAPQEGGKEAGSSSNGGFGYSGSKNQLDSSKVVGSSKISKVNGRSLIREDGQAGVFSGVHEHVVREGETLWELSSRYYANPDLWPALWSLNPQITNPHWIYPGDILRLGDEEVVKTVSSDGTVVESSPRRRFQYLGGAVKWQVMYVEKLPEDVGHILFSDSAHRMLSQGDLVQVDWRDPGVRDKVRGGLLFGIYHKEKSAVNEDGDSLGIKLLRVGSLRLVPKGKDKIWSAEVVEVNREIERGDIILPYTMGSIALNKSANQVGLESMVIDTVDLITQVGEEQYVLLNRGTKDGINVGNRAIIYERREGLGNLPESERDDHNKVDKRDTALIYGESWPLGRAPRAAQYPEQEELDELYGDRDYHVDDLPARRIGEVMVIYSEKDVSTGLVIDSSREINLGAKATFIKGY